MYLVFVCTPRSKYDPDLYKDCVPGLELAQAGLLPQGAQMLREYTEMMDGNTGRSLALTRAHFRGKTETLRGVRILQKKLATFLV